MERSGDRVLVEVCVEDVEGALAAERAGADRVELCADLSVGGTTPDLTAVRAALDGLERAGLQVLVRPRGGSFAFSPTEVEAMLATVAEVRRLPSRVPVGFVVGALTTDGLVDVGATTRLVEAAAGAPVTFHRAVDGTPDLSTSLEVLVDLGVDRVLTGGGPGSAAEGARRLRELTRQAGDRIVVLAAGGIRPHTVRDLLRHTGVREVHGRAPAEVGGRSVTSEDVARALVAACRRPLDD